MASKPITCESAPEFPASYGFDAAARSRSLSAWIGAVTARWARAIADEVRARRDTRKLMVMSDELLKDIGLARAEIRDAVRFGRD